METRRIKARNGEGLAFSVVGEGTGPLGDFYELLDEKTSIATIEQALASGIKVFDSSPHYGNGLAEARIGAGLRRAKRDEILVSTKIGRIMDPFTKPPKPRSDVVSPGFAGGHPHAPRFDYSYDGAMRSIEHSLLRMGLDRIDIVLIHDCDVWTHGKEEAPGRFKEAMEGAYKALDKLRNEKVVKAIGVGSRALVISLALQAVLLSVIAAGLGVVLGAVLAPAFPMSISLGVRNCLELVAAAVGVGIVASVMALRRAIGVDPAVAFGGG